MGKVVMTLLVPRKAKKDARYPYAVQMSWPEINPRTGTQKTRVSVRLIHNKDGEQLSKWETRKHYHPEKWKAAEKGQLAEMGLLQMPIPRPWYPYGDGSSDLKDVYDFPGFGDQATNNNQEWPQVASTLIARWNAERKRRTKFDKEQRKRRNELHKLQKAYYKLEDAYDKREQAEKKREQAEIDRRTAKWGFD